MEGSLSLSADNRKVLLQIYRNESGAVSRRAQVVLLAVDGWSQRDIRRATFTSFDFITEKRSVHRVRQRDDRYARVSHSIQLHRWKLAPHDAGWERQQTDPATVR